MEDEAYVLAPLAVRARALNDINARMRVDMQSHSLQPEQPLDETNDPPTESTTVDSKVNFDEETAEKAIDFLRMNVSTVSHSHYTPCMLIIHHIAYGAPCSSAQLPSDRISLLLLVWGTVCE
jgi:hypothetical protein